MTSVEIIRGNAQAAQAEAGRALTAATALFRAAGDNGVDLNSRRPGRLGSAAGGARQSHPRRSTLIGGGSPKGGLEPFAIRAVTCMKRETCFWSSTAPVAIRRSFFSRVHWVEPQLVAEITYLTWTADGLLRLSPRP